MVAASLSVGSPSNLAVPISMTWHALRVWMELAHVEFVRMKAYFKTVRWSRRMALSVAMASAGMSPSRAMGQRAYRFICPFPAGGTVDAVARSLNGALAAELGQPVLVDVRAGGNGALAAQQLLSAPADGETWMIATLGSTLAMMTGPARLDPARTLQCIALIASDISVLVAPTSLPVTDLTALLRLARQRPGGLVYLRTGEASLSHLVMGCIARQWALDLQAVDYRGQPPGIIDLLAGRLDLAVLNLGLAAPHIRGGRLRPLAVAGSARTTEFPDVPSLVEFGLADASVASWVMAVVRSGTPPQLIDTLRQAFARVLARPEVRAQLMAAGVVPGGSDDDHDPGHILNNSLTRNARLLAAVGIPLGGGSAGELDAPACTPPRENM